ncbi:MAG TPA: isocitrate lyase/phosphoenolpyruvate mutase family protein [Streptosporangiaceae bacterium]|nr:isocitrate lyase/phosphoenolpyruvate mutase family protein [Streptosporangiaceae bacterium]
MDGAKSQRLRKLFGGDRVIRAVGAHDALTARLVQEAGFEAIWASSLELSASHAVPDAGVLSLTQYLDAAEDMDEAVDLPVIADCDTGFGGPLNVAHLVRRYERRGIAAVCIEDKVFPKMNSFAEVDHPLVPTAEFAAKITAGKEAQQDSDFMVLARTEGFIAGLRTDAVLERGVAYAAAGADAVLVHSRLDRPDEVLAFARRWPLDIPLIAVPTTYHTVHEQELWSAGFRLVIYANHVIRAQVSAVAAMLGQLADQGTARAVEPWLVSMTELFRLQGMPAAVRIER